MGVISLRPLTLADTSNIVRWRNQPEVYKNLYSQNLITEEQHTNYFHKYVETGLVRQYIIVADINGTPVDIGTVFLKDIDSISNKAEYGLFIGELQAQGKGFASLVAEETLKIAFKNLGLNRVYLTVFANNVRAQKSYEKAGFRKEGVLRQDFFDGEKYVDIICMGILKSDYLALHTSIEY